MLIIIRMVQAFPSVSDLLLLNAQASLKEKIKKFWELIYRTMGPASAYSAKETKGTKETKPSKIKP